VLDQFVRLLDPELLARGLTPLFLMALPCLSEHAAQVVPILEALVVEPHEAGGASGAPSEEVLRTQTAEASPQAGNVSEALARALSELVFVPDHPALRRVKAALSSQLRLEPAPSARRAPSGHLGPSRAVSP